MRACILGAGGVFGNHLAAFLMEHKHSVIGIGRSPRKPRCFSLGIDFPYYTYHIGYEVEYVWKVFKEFKPEVIINFAAQGEGAASWGEDNWRFYDTNVTALVKLVSKVDCRFIQIGSSEVYGSVDAPVSEDSLTNPTSPYSASKLAFDHHLVAMHNIKGFPMNIIRPSNCYGEGQQLHRIIPKALISGLTGRSLPLHGGGVSKKSYLHVSDLCTAIYGVVQSGKPGEIYNVGPDEPTSIKEVVERCLKAVGASDGLINLAPERTGQDSCYWLDSTKIKSLGWYQETDWDMGLESMAAWVKSYPELLEMDTDFVMRA